MLDIYLRGAEIYIERSSTYSLPYLYPSQVARCTKIIQAGEGEDAKYGGCGDREVTPFSFIVKSNSNTMPIILSPQSSISNRLPSLSLDSVNELLPQISKKACVSGKRTKSIRVTSIDIYLPTIFFFSVDRQKYHIQIPLPPKIDASVTMMQVEEKPDVTYSDVGGCKEQIEKLREVVELPLLQVQKTRKIFCC